jgi:hypothetical protein
MSELIRRTKKNLGAALLIALQLTALTLISVVSFMGGPQPQQPANPPAGSQMSADRTQAQTARALAPSDKAALRKSAVFAKKLQEPLASQVFNLADSRAAESAQQSVQRSS